MESPTTAPMLAAILAAVSGLVVLVGGLAAYGIIVALPRRWNDWRARRLHALSRTIHTDRRTP